MSAVLIFRRISFLLIFLMATGAFVGCELVDVDPSPPYPLRNWDYTYPDQDDDPAPWVDPENYPYVTITAPADGSIVEPGVVTVTGVYQGPELAELTLNGRDIAVSGSTFTGTVTVGDDDLFVPIVVDAITSEKQRVSGDRVTVLQGAAGLPGDAATSLGLDLENRGLNTLADFIADLIDGFDLADLLNPKIAADGKAGLELSEASIEGVDLVVKSTTDGLALRVMIGQIVLDANLFGLDVYVDIQGMLLEAMMDVAVDENNEIVLTLVDSSFSVASLGMDGIMDDLASYLVGAVAELLLDQLVPGLLEDALAGLDLTITGNGYALSLLPALAVTGDRNFTLGFDSVLDVTDADVFDLDFQPDGYLTTVAGPPVFPEVTPVTGAPYGLGLTINDDFLNQVFYALAATGSLEFSLSEEFVTSEIMSLIFFSYRKIDPPLPVVFRFEPTVAPIVAGSAEDNTMYLVLPSFAIRAMIECGEDEACRAAGESDGYWEAMTVMVDVVAPLSFTFNDDQSLSLKLGELGLAVDVVHNAMGQKNIDNTERLFAELFGDVLPELLGDLLGGLQIKLPELAGLKISLADMATIGELDDNLGIFIDIQ
ncbi:MAG: hypothetical protein P9L99_08275 [Candidatus Lernaella stagnicola]|nr:hypothetical protein [Candidatus Lernaella stagnicola]